MEKVTTMSGRQSFMNVRQLTIAGLLTAVTVFLGVTGYGFIPLGFINATILHVPTIIAALTGGRRVGMTVGFMFGVFSFVQTLRAPAMLMLFAVQTSIVYDAAICIVPRVLLGLIAYEVNELAEKRGLSLYTRTALTAVIATVCHTVLFLGMYTLLVGSAFAEAQQIPFTNVINLMIGITLTNGIPEAIVCGLIVTPVVTALRKSGIVRS